MLLIRSLQHVNYNFLYSTMQQSFVTGLKLKNNLTSQLVSRILPRKNSCLWMAGTYAGTPVDPLFTPTATWDTQGTPKIT